MHSPSPLPAEHNSIELEDDRLPELQHPTSEVDEEALRRLWQKGQEAWRDVEHASAWVDALRGN